MKFKIGDRVVINEKGFRRFFPFEGAKGKFGNPKCEGTVTRLGDWLRVDWDNGSYNAYTEDTLNLVADISLENE